MNPITPEKAQQWVISNGLAIDRDEAWRKLISHQFGGRPGRGFAELIQNAIDSYPSATPMEDRKGEIKSDSYKISITDYGEGLTRKRIELLCTLGGTDKRMILQKSVCSGWDFSPYSTRNSAQSELS